MKRENLEEELGETIRASKIAKQRSANGHELSLKVESFGNFIVVHCQGGVSLGDHPQALSSIVAKELPSTGRMVVDLSEINFIDSNGLSELVLTHMWAEAAGYVLKFATPQKVIRDLFETTNLVSVLDVYGSVPEAVSGMANEEVRSA